MRLSSFHARFALRLLALSALCLLSLTALSRNAIFHQKTVSPEIRHLQELQARVAVSIGERCRVPQLDPWDHSIQAYYSKPDALVCKPVQEPVVTEDDGYLVFNSTLVKDLSCHVKSVSHNQGVSDSEVIFGEAEEIDLSKLRHQIPYEFVEVACKSGGLMRNNVFKYHFHSVKPRSESITSKLPIKLSNAERPSVVMIGLDSMSRSNFIRQLPRSYELMSEMGFIDMRSHVKIGDNTYANWLAILTGKRGSSTKEFDAELDESWDIAFDDFPIIWKDFSYQGYATLFAEDRPDIGTFNYFGYLCGFKNQPTDHYFRPYWLAAFYSIVARRSTPFCYDRLPHHKNQLEYLRSFTRAYSGRRHFAWWWTQDMSHDYLNLIGKTDKDVEGMLREPSLKDSIVIVFSDHGHRYDKIRETVLGRLEARLPFLSIRLPDIIREKYPSLEQRLTENSERLTSQFDLHATLLDIANGTFIRAKMVSSEPRRGYSLFERIPEKRTCSEAGIPEDYCPCFSELHIPSEEAGKPAEVLLSHVNELLRGDEVRMYSEDEQTVAEEAVMQAQGLLKGWKCLPLEITKIVFSSVKLPPAHLMEDPQADDTVVQQLTLQYRIAFQAQSPSNAQIEGVVLRDVDSGRWTATGELERNNKSLLIHFPLSISPFSKRSATVFPSSLKRVHDSIPFATHFSQPKRVFQILQS